MHRLLLPGLLCLLAQAAQPPQQPPLKSGVEMVLVDVQVTDRNGQPAADLRPEQFDVRIDGDRRPVRSLELVRLSTAPIETAADAATPEPGAPPPGDEGRTLILAIDQASLIVASEPAALEVVRRLSSMANPRDAIGLVAYPGPGVSLAPTRDRQALLDAAKKIGGQLQLPRGRVVLSLADAIDWTTDADYRDRILKRECPGDGITMADMCYRDVEMVANEMVSNFQMQAMRSVDGLQSVVEAVREYPGRKTLVIVSAGFAVSDRMGGKPDVRAEADMLGRRAAQANAVIYSLHMNVGFLQAFSAASAGRELQTVFRNSQILAGGLDQFTGSGGGSLITVHAGPDEALQRLLTETSAYYLVGVEPLPEHRDGDVHRIQVRVDQRGAVVRSRASVLIPKAPGL